MKLNKAAMFGLCRTLRKQSGRLFLASRHSEAPQGASGSCGYYKHGAMFGLDARIALAIFGALSVISGAALYSAIQQAKVTALITDMNEVGKAWEQYLLDTGNYMEISTAIASHNHERYLKLQELIASNKDGWQGPYISDYTMTTNGCNCIAIRNTIYGDSRYMFALGRDTSWTDAQITGGVCNTTDPCYVWVSVHNINTDISNAVDIAIDGSSTPNSGRLKFIPDVHGNNYIFYKYAMTPSPA